MKTAKVNGFEISKEAVGFELDRLVRFYMSHGMSMEEVRSNLPRLQEKALDQAIGARLLLERSTQLDIALSDDDIDAEVAKRCNFSEKEYLCGLKPLQLKQKTKYYDTGTSQKIQVLAVSHHRCNNDWLRAFLLRA